jgi:phage protein D
MALSYPVRHPRWVLTYAGRNITADVTGMVTAISYRDQVEHLSDEVELTLEDSDHRWQGPWFPVRGDFVELFIGYEGEELLDCGDFQVDELELKGPPDSFHLKCIAAGITLPLRSPRSARYENQTLLQVAQTVAARHGMSVVGVPQNINVAWTRISQRTETDLNFLRSLAIRHNYDFSIRGQQLIFYARTLLEQNKSLLTLMRGGSQAYSSAILQNPRVIGGVVVKGFEFKTRTQQIYRSATVAYLNPQQKRLIAAQAGDSSAPTGDDLHIVTRCEVPAQAQLKADSALHDANMMQVTGRMEMEGTILAAAGVNMEIRGFSAFDGKYHIESSRHRVERASGYTTEVEVRKV